MRDTTVRTLTALAIGAVGAAIATTLRFPAPVLMGPAILVTLAAVMGVRLHMPVALRNTAFIVIGIGMGSGVTPETLQAARTWPFSVLAMPVVVTAILFGGAFAVARIFRFDWRTSVLAASPGHLSYVLGLGLDVRADVGTVTVVQSLRLLALTLLVPVVVMLGGVPGTAGEVAAPLPLPALVATILCAALAGWGLQRAGVPAALLLGGMGVSAIAHGAGIVHGGVPLWLSVPAFLVMGTLIGTRFDGAKLATLRAAAGAALVLTTLSVALAMIGAFAVTAVTGLPVMQVLIAFAPGGVETMAAMAVLLDADPAYVAAHHVLRLFVLTGLVPLALRLGR
ncbi:AbrB family transcriptional regulator [Roseobacter sp. HKCCA0434]|uniref:AbrB family transcriptional regulator n=1 Tax=Roseobacter sp. HKCCA0434 TaxID=3079297 RepID=UPI002905EF3E|nr:AbrB family transcriptional regulator [Roseobacter sp. HKCCA0434]